MRRIRRVIACVIVSCSLLTACNPFDEKSTETIVPFEDRLIDFSYETEPEDIITYTLTNKSDVTYLVGNQFRMEYRDDEEWYRVPYKPLTVFTMEGIIMPKGDTREFKAKLSMIYEDLPDGHYRLIKDVGPYDNPKEEEFSIAIEFDYPFE